MQVMWTANPLGRMHSISVRTRALAISLASVAVLLVIAGIASSVIAFKVASDYAPGFVARMGGMLTMAEAERRESAYRGKLNGLHEEIVAAERQLQQLRALTQKFATLAIPRGLRLKRPELRDRPGQGGPRIAFEPDDAAGIAGTEGGGWASDPFRAARARVERLSLRLSKTQNDWRRELSRLEHAPIVPPVADMHGLSSNFGVRIDPFTGLPARHEGVDISAPSGTPILATASGVVVRVAVDPQYGRMVDIDHGNGYLTRYAHARAIYVKPKEHVRRGEVIGAIGSTGRSTGPHLHYEVRWHNRPQDPVDYGLPGR